MGPQCIDVQVPAALWMLTQQHKDCSSSAFWMMQHCQIMGQAGQQMTLLLALMMTMIKTVTLQPVVRATLLMIPILSSLPDLRKQRLASRACSDSVKGDSKHDCSLERNLESMGPIPSLALDIT